MGPGQLGLYILYSTSDVDGEIIIPDDGSLNASYYMAMYGTGMYLGKRMVEFSIGLDERVLGKSLIGVVNGLRT